VQVAGDGATELVHLGQMAIIGRMSVDTFANATFNFPTMAEAYRIAALEIIHARDWKVGAVDADGCNVSRLQPGSNV
jgi:NAD(P) transhydrogenase